MGRLYDARSIRPSPPNWGVLRASRLALLAAVLTHASCADADDPAQTTERPHVVLISIDTLRWDHTSLAGYERDTTPYLRRLAQESIVFERAHTTTSWTLPTHMSMLTGLYPEQHTVWKKDAVLPKTVSTIAERLRAEGYFTVGLFKPGWIHERFGFGRGFDVFQPHRDAELAGKHLDSALSQRPADRPLFLFLHIFDVHCVSLKRNDRPPYDPTDRWAEHFLPGSLERVAGLEKQQIWAGSADVTPEQHEAIVSLYDDAIRHVDARLEEWIEGLRRDGLLDSTLLIITADHGESLNQRGQRYGGHGNQWEEGLRVPLLVRLPDGRSGGERVDAPVSLVDLVPTIEDFLGLEPDGPFPGRSLLRPPQADRVLFAQRRRGRIREEIIIHWPTKVRRDLVSGRSVSIFDLSRDPGELSPLPLDTDVDEHLRLAAEQKAGWIFHNADVQAERDPELEEHLRGLGYLGGEEEDDE